MNCPYCDHNKTHKNGKTSTGNPRYLCQGCKKSFIDKINPSKKDIREADEYKDAIVREFIADDGAVIQFAIWPEGKRPIVKEKRRKGKRRTFKEDFEYEDF